MRCPTNNDKKKNEKQKKKKKEKCSSIVDETLERTANIQIIEDEQHG